MGKAAVIAAETSLKASLENEKAASTEVEVAAAAAIEAEGVVTKPKAEDAAMVPTIQQAKNKHGDRVFELDNFENGPMASFTKLNSKAAALKEDVASAGA